MKKLFLVGVLLSLAFFLPPLPACAQTASHIKVVWQMKATDLPYVKEFKIYSGNSPDPTVVTNTLAYTGQATLTANVAIKAPGNPGDTVKQYISVSAVSKSGDETAKAVGLTSAGKDFLEFVVPYPDVSIPFEVIIEIVFEPTAQPAVKGAKK